MATNLTAPFAAELIQKRTGLPSNSQARIIEMFPEALKRLARKVAANQDLRDLMLTDKDSVSLAISSGKVDLTTLYSTHKALKEFIDYGQIWHSSSNYPLQKVNPNVGANLTASGATTTDFIYYYIRGKYLILPGNETGNLSFAVPKYPTSISQLPDSDEVETLFLDTVIEMLAGEKTDFTNQQLAVGQ